MKSAFFCVAMVILSCGFTLGQAQEKVLWTFTGTPDGSGQKSKLVFDNEGNLYGTTATGGTLSNQECGEFSGCGMVYKLSPQADGSWTEETIYKFCDGSNNNTCPDGKVPEAGLVFDNSGNLYGTTTGGGMGGGGVVFELSPPSSPGGTWVELVLYNFCSNKVGSQCVDGQGPASDLVFDHKGNLYGTTSGGGSGHLSSNVSGGGTAFELSHGAEGWTHAVLYNFCSLGQRDHCPDGAGPSSPVTLLAGNLYGVTALGGTSDDGGIVYELSPSPNGWTETVIHNFTSQIGGYHPEGPVSVGPAGELFGTVYYGGASGLGAVFRIGPKGAYGDIAPGTGMLPTSGVLIDAARGFLYGATVGGGNDFYYGTGTVFQISASGQTTSIYSFCSQLNCTDGSEAGSALIEDASGNLYGTTVVGGTKTGWGCVDGGCGVVYEIIPQ